MENNEEFRRQRFIAANKLLSTIVKEEKNGKTIKHSPKAKSIMKKIATLSEVALIAFATSLAYNPISNYIMQKDDVIRMPAMEINTRTTPYLNEITASNFDKIQHVQNLSNQYKKLLEKKETDPNFSQDDQEILNGITDALYSNKDANLLLALDIAHIEYGHIFKEDPKNITIDGAIKDGTRFSVKTPYKELCSYYKGDDKNNTALYDFTIKIIEMQSANDRIKSRYVNKLVLLNGALINSINKKHLYINKSLIEIDPNICDKNTKNKDDDDFCR